MSGIISISRDTQNNVSFVRIITTDTLATVVTANYIKNQMPKIRALNNGFWQWYSTDMLLIAASDNNALFTFTDATFASLNEYSGGASGVVTPGLANQLAYYAANGSTVSGLTSVANSILATDGSAVPGWTQSLPHAVQVSVFSLDSGAGATDLTFYRGDGTWAVPESSLALTNAHIFVGNASNLAIDVAMSGDATMANTGAITVSKIGGKAITLANSFTTSGNFTVTQTYTGNTNVTFPTTGTLATTSQLPTPAALTKTDDTNVTLTLGGTPATALLQATSLTLGWTGILSVSRGGTGVNTINAYSIISGNTTGTGIVTLSTGSAGQLMASQGATTLARFTNATYPDSISANQILYASADDVISALSLISSGVLTSVSNVPTWTSTLSGALGGTGVANTGLTINLGSGTTGYVLTSDSSGNATWQAAGGGGVTSTQIQDQAFTYAVDSGAANAYVIALSPVVSSYSDGQSFTFKATNANSGASTLNAGGGAIAIVTNNNAALTGGEILANGMYIVEYNSSFSAFVLVNSSASGSTPALTNTHIFVGNASNVATDVAMSGDATIANTGAIKVGKLQSVPVSLFAADTGIVNAYVVTYTTDPGAYTSGQIIAFEPFHTNTGASTINVNGHGVKSIITSNGGTSSGSALTGGELVAGLIYLLQYSPATAKFVLLNSSLVTPSSSLATKVGIQNQSYTYAADSGAANAYVIALSPVVTSYTDGQLFSFRAQNPNSGASTLNAGGGAIAIVTNNNAALVGGEILFHGDYLVMYSSDFSAFVLINSSLNTGVTATQVQQNAFNYAVDSGAANAYVVTLSPAPASYTDGMYVAFESSNSNTGASTINVNGIGAINIILNNNIALVGGEIVANGDYVVVYNTSYTAFVLINPTVPKSTTVSSVIPNASSVSLTTATATDLTSISLSVPGKYLLMGNISFEFSIGGNNCYAWFNTVSATAPDPSLYNNQILAGGGLYADVAFNTPSIPVTVTTTTTYYLSAYATFASGTGTVCGGIYAIYLGTS